MGDDSDTPVIVDAPKELTAAPDITDHVRNVFGRYQGSVGITGADTRGGTALPSGISPEALAPQNPNSGSELSTTVISGENAQAAPREEDTSIPLSGASEDKNNTSATGRGGFNR
jgi:hypothetical protein